MFTSLFYPSLLAQIWATTVTSAKRGAVCETE
jgi:hypothetical protein